jgi:hypothetical protein
MPGRRDRRRRALRSRANGRPRTRGGRRSRSRRDSGSGRRRSRTGERVEVSHPGGAVDRNDCRCERATPERRTPGHSRSRPPDPPRSGRFAQPSESNRIASLEVMVRWAAEGLPRCSAGARTRRARTARVTSDTGDPRVARSRRRRNAVDARSGPAGGHGRASRPVSNARGDPGVGTEPGAPGNGDPSPRGPGRASRRLRAGRRPGPENRLSPIVFGRPADVQGRPKFGEAGIKADG